MSLTIGQRASRILALRPRSLLESTDSRSGTLETASACAKVCGSCESIGGPGTAFTTPRSAEFVCCSFAVATSEHSPGTLIGHGSTLKTTRKGIGHVKRKASVSHDDAIVRRLRRDPDFAAEYLKSALEDTDEPRVLLIALRHLAKAQGIAKVAKAAGVERESLYRALSANGNPRLSTLVAVTKAIGLRLTVEAA